MNEQHRSLVQQVQQLTDRKLTALERQASAMERVAEAIEEALPMLAVIVQAMDFDGEFDEEAQPLTARYLDGTPKG